jgi:hypothetical protein
VLLGLENRSAGDTPRAFARRRVIVVCCGGRELLDGPPPALATYFRLCDEYRCVPHPPVVLALKYAGVTYLQLEKSFGQADLIPLCEALKDNDTVTAIDLRRCSVGSPGCHALKHLIMCNHHIKLINLCNNDIGEHGAQALAEGAPRCRATPRGCCMLCGCWATHFPRAVIVAGLARNTTVQSLHLRGNRIGAAGVYGGGVAARCDGRVCWIARPCMLVTRLCRCFTLSPVGSCDVMQAPARLRTS